MQDKFKYRAFIKKENKIKDVIYYMKTEFDEKCYVVCVGFKPDGFDITYFINEKYLMQCTGLKDKNGNLIYEGDIVSLDNGELKGIAIRHEKLDEYYGCVFIRLISKHETLYKPTVFAESEIIGNIYENPDMLEEK